MVFRFLPFRLKGDGWSEVKKKLARILLWICLENDWFPETPYFLKEGVD